MGITKKIIDTLDDSGFDIDGIYYEEPQALDNACTAKGDLVKLSTMAGAIIGALGCRYSVIADAVRICDWKGQLKKEHMLPRIERIMKRRRCKLHTKASHEMDAVGIGLYLLGEL